MHVRDWGTGPAVLILHGCPSTTKSLEPLVAPLAAKHRVLLPDLPGYGPSPALPGPYSFDRVGTLLEEELLARGIREVAIVGHSAGSYRALSLALDAKRVRVTRLVLLGAIAGLDPETRAAFRQFAEMARTGFDFQPMWLGRMGGPGFAERFPDKVPEVMAWIDAAPREVLAAELDAFADAPDLRPRLRDLTVPVTARVGEHDAATPPVCSEEIVQRVVRGELQVVPGCGHALLSEDAAATVAAVVQALA